MAERPYCWFFIKPIGCANGTDCPYKHDRGPAGIADLEERRRRKRACRKAKRKEALVSPLTEGEEPTVEQAKAVKSVQSKKEKRRGKKPGKSHLILTDGKRVVPSTALLVEEATPCALDLRLYCYYFLTDTCERGPYCLYLHQWPSPYTQYLS
jgi:hypothetical protein